MNSSIFHSFPENANHMDLPKILTQQNINMLIPNFKSESLNNNTNAELVMNNPNFLYSQSNQINNLLRQISLQQTINTSSLITWPNVMVPSITSSALLTCPYVNNILLWLESQKLHLDKIQNCANFLPDLPILPTQILTVNTSPNAESSISDNNNNKHFEKENNCKDFIQDEAINLKVSQSIDSITSQIDEKNSAIVNSCTAEDDDCDISNRNDASISSGDSSISVGANGSCLNRKRRKSGFQTGITVGYTYEAFFISDGRSKKRKRSEISINTTDENIYKKPKVKESSKNENSTINFPDEIHEPIEFSISTSPTPKQQRFVCAECGKHYATSSNLSRHKQTHRTLDSSQARKCPHCEKIYVSMPALAMHVLTHDLRHRCDVCGKAFSRPWLLQGHRRAHTGEKPYGCAHCGRAFADRSNLRAHMQTHSGSKLHECLKCRKNFTLKSYLNKHLEACIHNNIDTINAESI